MREIKFRAWLKNTKEIVEVTDVNFYEKTISYIIDDYANITQIWEDSEFEEVELMQFTGLKDKNGVEIYEGDIVEIKDHAFQKQEGDHSGIQIDGYYEVGYTENTELVAGSLMLFRSLSYVQVVGNVYENKKLLEVTE